MNMDLESECALWTICIYLYTYEYITCIQKYSIRWFCGVLQLNRNIVSNANALLNFSNRHCIYHELLNGINNDRNNNNTTGTRRPERTSERTHTYQIGRRLEKKRHTSRWKSWKALKLEVFYSNCESFPRMFVHVALFSPISQSSMHILPLHTFVWHAVHIKLEGIAVLLASLASENEMWIPPYYTIS